LSQKYPKIVVDVVELETQTIDGVKVPMDTSQPNPNNLEFDNLYLDMNGIIHPCSHPEDRPAPKNEDEIMINIMDYIDRLFAIVRPRRLLYMAVGSSLFLSLLTHTHHTLSPIPHSHSLQTPKRWSSTQGEDESTTVETVSIGQRSEREE
jgi:hypothetical protein